MAQDKPAEHILSEMTRLGSSLAQLASKELDVVLGELRGSAGAAGPEADVDHTSVNLGTLATSAMQMLAKVGEVIVQLSKYDLVRNDVPRVTLRATNPIASYSIPAGAQRSYDFLLENDGAKSESFAVSATLLGRFVDKKEDRPLELAPRLESLEGYERRSMRATLPELPPGTYYLRIEVKKPAADGTPAQALLARRTIQLQVREPPADIY